MSANHQHGFIDPYTRLDSPIHKLGAPIKLIAVLAIISVTVSLPVTKSTATTFFPLLLLFLIAIAGLSLIPINFLLRRLLLTEPLILGVGILTLFQPHGLHLFTILVLRSTMCLATMLLLASTTPFADLLEVLRRFRVPAILITTIALMYRYLYVLVDESARMRRARASRTFTKSRSRAWSDLANLIGQLFLRTADRADRIYAAMCARGWQ